MNRAMWLQRVRSLDAERVRRGETSDLATIDVPGVVGAEVATRPQVFVWPAL